MFLISMLMWGQKESVGAKQWANTTNSDVRNTRSQSGILIMCCFLLFSALQQHDSEVMESVTAKVTAFELLMFFPRSTDSLHSWVCCENMKRTWSSINSLLELTRNIDECTNTWSLHCTEEEEEESAVDTEDELQRYRTNTLNEWNDGVLYGH